MNLEDITSAIEGLPAAEQEGLLATLAEYEASVKRERAQKNFIPYVNEMWPGFIAGRHHKVMAKKFEEIAEGKIKRVIINLAPRHTKSEFASYLLPSWFLGKFPNKKIIQCSNTADLAVGFGRKVRNLVGSEQYSKVFPNVSLRQDSKAAGRWSTNHNGEYFAIGVGGTVTGKGADLLIIDDPHSEQEARLAASSPEIFDSVYEWYTSGPRQRLQPGGTIIVVMCMTGDTPVLMANGTEKPLKDVRAGDFVATFDKGELTTETVNGWRSNGLDSIYKIQTQSGKILRANERHPFLIDNNGVLEWTRLKNLEVGDLLVSLKDAAAPQKPKQKPENAALVNQQQTTTKKILTPHTEKLEVTASGKKSHALNQSATGRLVAKDSVRFIIQRVIGHLVRAGSLQKNAENTVLKVVMELLRNNTMQWLQSATTGVMYAISHPQTKILAPTGTTSYALTTATTQAGLEGFFATTATSQLGTQKQPKLLSQLHLISDFTTDPITAITHDGNEEVFDVEINRTENFIANGIVSHNTRWSKKDLSGRIMQSALERDGEKWELIEFPAILPSGNPLWPEFWSLEELSALRDELPAGKWNAQYQQTPTAEEGAIIKREWWQIWDKEDPPPCDIILQSWDTAFEAKTRSDYSACTTWGVFHKDENPDDAHIILLDAFKKRMEFPELKQKALDYREEWNPDIVIIEKKASGAPLIYELRSMGLSIDEFTPTKGNDKVVRLNAVSDLFASGKVWAPPTRWADEVIEEVASFPYAPNDDYTDTVSLALSRFRRGGMVRARLDEEDEPRTFRRRGAYY